MTFRFSSLTTILIAGFMAMAPVQASAQATGGAPAPKLEYKGRTISGAPAAKNNQVFFDTVKKAIDMSETLPARQKQLAAQVKDLRYEPPASTQTGNISDSIVGVYMTGKDVNTPGYISFRKNPEMSSSLEYLTSMIGNAGYDIWRIKMAEGFGELNAARKAKDSALEKKSIDKLTYYQNLFSKKDPDLNVLAECAINMDQLATL